MAGHPLRPATRQSLGRPLPHQQADRPRAHPPPKKLSTTRPCGPQSYPVLIPVSGSYPKVKGRLLTCYSPVRRSSTPKGLSARLTCVKHAASVRPEPGSNSPLNSSDNHSFVTVNSWLLSPGKRTITDYCQNHRLSYQRNRRRLITGTRPDPVSRTGTK